MSTFTLTLDAEPTDPGRCPNRIDFIGWQCERRREHTNAPRSLCRVTLPRGAIEWTHAPIEPAPSERPYFTPDGARHELHETHPL